VVTGCAPHRPPPPSTHRIPSAHRPPRPARQVHIPESSDPAAFDPAGLAPLPELKADDGQGDGACSFLFLSVFKAEFRKGWDLLLKAFVAEFQQSDGVCLLMVTDGTTTRDGESLTAFLAAQVSTKKKVSPKKQPPRVRLHTEGLSQEELRRFYKSADAFALPSRSEPSGKIVMEAMLMELPVLASAFGGQSDFMTKNNSYSLKTKMVDIPSQPGADLRMLYGKQWCEASVPHLKSRMRHVVKHPKEARRKGVQARKDIARRYNPALIGRKVRGLLEASAARLSLRQKQGKGEL
jgi:glycosyltransferase involved in cell wall biosynthesis